MACGVDADAASDAAAGAGGASDSGGGAAAILGAESGGGVSLAAGRGGGAVFGAGSGRGAALAGVAGMAGRQPVIAVCMGSVLTTTMCGAAGLGADAVDGATSCICTTAHECVRARGSNVLRILDRSPVT